MRSTSPPARALARSLSPSASPFTIHLQPRARSLSATTGCGLPPPPYARCRGFVILFSGDEHPPGCRSSRGLGASRDSDPSLYPPRRP